MHLLSGLKKGVPDIVIAVTRRVNGSILCPGAYLEMKSQKGELSPMQVKWIARLDAQGYATCVTYDFETAQKFIKDYLGPMPLAAAP